MPDVIPVPLSTRFRRGSAFAGLALSSLLLLEEPVAARSPAPSSNGAYSVRLEDDQGNALPTFRQSGTTFVLGDLRERYNVRIENRTDRRVEAVLTVDGRGAVSGRLGNFVNERGYLVPPHGSVLVDGFRQSLAQAAAFRFSRPEESYSSRMGTPENVGIVGVAFFSERHDVQLPVRRTNDEPRWRIPRELTPNGYRSDGMGGASTAPKAAAPSAAPPATGRGRSADGASASHESDRPSARDDAGSSAPRGLGTEYGEAQYSPVTEVRFERQNPSRPDSILSLRYDDADGLTARGIDVSPHEYSCDAADAPSPFPENRFAPPPP
jgi:hypothetical protein